jgi:hypothetical protein
MLRAGHRLQWRGLARELVARILNFRYEETYMLVVQASWQVGCSGTRPCRESHIDLEEEEFGMSLLSALEDALGTVEGNWQGASAARTYIAVASRLLSMSPHSTVHDGCYRFLRRARAVALRWVRDVRQLIHEGQDADELTILNLRALEVALTCHGTFDIDREHLPALLMSVEDIAVITECCISIRDHCPAVTQNLPRPLKIMLQRYEKISHFLEPELRALILLHREGIDSTIQRVWAGYRPGSSWDIINTPNERWLVTQTSAESGYSSVTVHYNILDGSLLVNGSLLARLPESYELHKTYRRLFGEVRDVPYKYKYSRANSHDTETPRCRPIYDGRNAF